MERQSHAEASAQAPIIALPAGLTLPLDVRVHGRGGQGGVTCAKLIAALYMQMGLHVQTFGDYGSERSGAPVQAYTRVDRIPIANRNKVYRPDHLIVLDEGLLGTQTLGGAAPGALLLLNSSAGLHRYDGQYADYQFAVIDATAIARELGIGSSSVVIINTTMLGAYARLLGAPLSVLEGCYASLGLGGDLPAAQQAYQRVRMRARTVSHPAVPAPAAAAASPPVAPISAHNADIPASLKTGSWSNQAPLYQEVAAPCNLACPAGNDVVGFIQALKNDGAEAAAAILQRTQALPSVCGRVCPAPCMRACNRDAFDGAVNIRSLERWISDCSAVQLTQRQAAARRRFAIAGGGSAGLSAAYQLALRGHEVKIFEAGPALGGVLRNGIPAFRLPQDALQRDLDRILALGVEAQCDCRLYKDDLARLQQTYDALIVCVGFGPAFGLAAEGAALEGVEQGLAFLDRAKRGRVTLAGHVAVVGGGNTAIDCARTALRCGAASVKLVYRRGHEEMPAIREEIEAAELEGVRLVLHRQPLAFTGDGTVSAMLLAEVETGPPDASGRRSPLVTQRTSRIACDKVLLALGQSKAMDLLPDTWRMRGARAWQGNWPLPVWFAGDCASGEGTVAHAIGNGGRAAAAALAHLAQAPDEAERETPDPVAPAQIRFSHFEMAPPHRDRQIPPSARRHSFDEFNLGLAGPDEAGRCFSCGRCTHCDTCLIYCPEGVIYRSGDGYRIDTDYCKGCGMCVAECPRSAIQMHAKTRQEVSACL